MSIRSMVGNATRTVQNNIGSVLNEASSFLENATGTITTQAAHLWDGGFAGMSESGIQELVNILEKYCADMETIINGFNADADLSGAIKGSQIEPAIRKYVESVKKLLQAYVSRIRVEKDEANEAWTNFRDRQQEISQDVEQVSSDIQQEAEKIRLD